LKIMLAGLAITAIEDADVTAVVSLWERCGLTRPWNDPVADIALARKGPNSTILLGREDERIVASAMVGHDGHRGWVYYVATDPDRRGKGLGRAIMNAAEDWLRQAGIAKLQLLVRQDNAKASAFYETIGYDEAAVTVFAKWLDGREQAPQLAPPEGQA
jgi:ribosomal protein S18 acetylase RimI-like enzyme